MLSEEQRASMLEQVSNNISDDTPSDILSVDATTGGSVQEIKVEDVKTESADPEAKESVTVEVETSEEVETETNDVEPDDNSPQHKGHGVPYSRFKNVLESRNQFRTEVDTYKSRVSGLEEKLKNLEQSKAQQQSFQQPQVERTWLDDYLDTEDKGAAPEWQSQYSTLDQRLYKFEVAQEENKLKTELAEIEKVYPNIPQKVLLKAVVNDPNVNMTALAEQYNAYLVGVEEQAIARYVESQGGQEKAASPENKQAEPLQRPRSTSAPRGKLAPSEKPKTVGGASKMLRDLLSKDNFLK